MQFDKKRPIYEQLIEYLKSSMLNGTYPPGSELPSRRNFAQELSVNPNTVQRAFKALEDEGLIETGNNVKSTVTQDQTKINTLKHQILTIATKEYYQKIEPLALSINEIMQEIELTIKKHGGADND